MIIKLKNEYLVIRFFWLFKNKNLHKKFFCDIIYKFEKNKKERIMKELDLGKEKISKLLLAFAVPCVISMLINSIYNIVDQIFIGKGVGTLGNAATNVIFPLVIIFSASAGLIGNGAAANLSLKLGENDKEEANKIFNTSFILLHMDLSFSSIELISYLYSSTFFSSFFIWLII